MATKDFVDYSPVSGSNNGSIDITAPRNPQMKPRSAHITVTGYDKANTPFECYISIMAQMM